MTRALTAAGVRSALAALALAAGGCGLGAGPSSEGTVTLTVTRDYGAERLLEATAEDPSASETVIRLLDREAEVATRYGGGFVQSIEGLAGTVQGGRSYDWFFYVNGIESPVGAADAQVRGGDRIWWDYRDWTDAMRVPAVVGSWPEPFAQASAGSDRLPVRVECAAAARLCDAVAGRLADAGASPSVETAPGEARGDVGGDAENPLRVLVGAWARLRRDGAAALLDGGPATSGVFARFERAAREWELQALDQRAAVASRFGEGAGLVAAVRDGDAPPVWLVTGTDAAGVEAAAKLLDEEALRDRYAVAAAENGEVALPLSEAG